MALIERNHMKKINYSLLLLIISAFNSTLNCKTNVTSTFHNTADFSVKFQSFQDKNSNPIETKFIEPHESFHSNIQADATVRYEVASNIKTQHISMSTGSKNIVFNTPNSRNSFDLRPGSLPRKDIKDDYLSDTSVMRINNETTFPIYISIIFKDAGQIAPTLVPDQVKKTTIIADSIPTQALNQTRLPIHGSYSTDDPITSIQISSAIKKYISHDLPLAHVKSQYDIMHKQGKLTLIPTEHKI